MIYFLLLDVCLHLHELLFWKIPPMLFTGNDSTCLHSCILYLDCQ